MRSINPARGKAPSRQALAPYTCPVPQVQGIPPLKQVGFTGRFKKPAVIISASGMAEAGRILHHLRNNIEDPSNTILIVGWQAPHTLGRRLADRETKIKIFGEKFNRKARVETIGGLSAHAGRDLLFEYASAVKDQVQKIFLVHAEDRGALPLKKELEMKGFKEVYYPEPQSVFEI